MPLTKLVSFVIILSSIVTVGYLLSRIVNTVRNKGIDASGLRGLAIAVMALFGIFRDTPPKKENIELTTSKKKTEAK